MQPVFLLRTRLDARQPQIFLLRTAPVSRGVALLTGRVVASPLGVALAQLRSRCLEERVVVFLDQQVEQLVVNGGDAVVGLDVRVGFCRRHQGLDGVGRALHSVRQLRFHVLENLVRQAGRQILAGPPVRRRQGLEPSRIQRLAAGVLVVAGVIEDGFLPAHER